ncbi:MAG TPA: cupin domain-containing protein [Thermoanaerobaculia bacterium]|jgi:quercetin dioxygenase-like cupin family protein
MRRWFCGAAALLLAACAHRAAVTPAAAPSDAATPAAATPAVRPVPIVRLPSEGEPLINPSGTILVKVDPTTGSSLFAMGTQEIKPNSGIPMHVHETEDEILFVHEGTAVGTVGDEHVTAPAGTTIFIPRGTWHGVETPNGAVTLVWFVTPPGLEWFFRATRSKPGEPPKSLTREELDDIARKHHMKFAPRKQ